MARAETKIGFGGEDPDDRAFAEQLAARLREHSAVRLIDIDALERGVSFGSFVGRIGPTIYIVSRSLLSSSGRRASLRASSPARNLPGSLTCYICRGWSSEQLRDEHPELEALFQDVMVGDESSVNVLAEQVRDWFNSPHPEDRLRHRVAGLLKFLIIAPTQISGFLFISGYMLFALPIGLLGWYQVFWGTDRTEAVAKHAWVLALLVGLVCNRVPALDLHPWTHGAGSMTSRAWQAAARDWAGFVLRARASAFVRFTFFSLPALALLHGAAPGRLSVAGVALAFGLTWPTLYYWATRTVQRAAYLSQGLTPREMRRTEQFFFAGIRFDRNRTTSSARLRRALIRPRDQVFISYSWKAEEARPTAGRLASTLASLNIECFIDKQRILGPFAAWRSNVASAIVGCTHAFVVLDPEVNDSTVMKSELRSLMHRWETELFPVVICVVADDVAELLESARHTPTYLKRLLAICPRLHPDEVNDPAQVAKTIAAYRFQGLLADWRTLFWPRAAFQRWFREGDPTGESWNWASNASFEVGLGPVAEAYRLVAMVAALYLGWAFMIPHL